MVLAVYGARQLLQPLQIPALALLATCAAVGVFVYAAYVLLIDKEGLQEIRQVLADFGVPERLLSRWPFSLAPMAQNNI